jgi:hypothetical protein
MPQHQLAELLKMTRPRSWLMWVLADVVGLFSINLVSFSHNVGRRVRIFSANVVPKSRCFRAGRFMFSGRYSYSCLARIPMDTTTL